MPQPQATSAAECPLCGQPNQCALAQGQPADECWCMHGVITPAVLASLAPQERGQRCICPSCGRGLQAPSGAPPVAPI